MKVGDLIQKLTEASEGDPERVVVIHDGDTSTNLEADAITNYMDTVYIKV